ncbi:o-succinylbenzoate synthase [Enterococcus faecalis]
MKIEKVEVYQVRLPLKSPFITSYGRLDEKAFDLFILTDELGNQGFGELVPFEQPDYVEETLATARLIINEHLLPLVAEQTINHPREVATIFAQVKGNWMAKAALETALWDLYAKREGKSLKEFFNEVRPQIPVGISLGIQTDLTLLLAQVQAAVAQGYQRVKIKIQPGYDLEPVAVIRQQFPQLPLMVDANSAYSLADLDHLQRLDAFHLTMIEQPFAAADFLNHAYLQQKMQTRICLDENIRSVADCQLAVALGSCRSINLKIPRVGGISAALEILKYCQSHDLLVWLGGMFESGVGRALNLQFASQAAFTFPGDLSASERYYYQDVITEPFQLENGQIKVPTGLGIGVSLDQEALEKYGTYHCFKKISPSADE